MNDRDLLQQAADRFPKEFGLRRFPGDRFCISLCDSFVSEGRVMLYTRVLREDQWCSFAKGTEAELLGQVVELD